MRKKKIAAILALVCVIIVALMLGMAMTAEAKSTHPRNGWYEDSHGDLYYYRHGKAKTGYFRVNGKLYYGHKTNGAYPKGAVTRGQMRIRNGNWYAFSAEDGARIEKDKYIRKGRTGKCLQVDIRSRNHTVRYIYGTSYATYGTRYSTARKRWQQQENGKWVDVGMQIIPGGWVDTQK